MTILIVVPGYEIRLRITAVPHCRSLLVEKRHVELACAFAPQSYTIFEERNKGDLKAAVLVEAFQCRLAFLADMFGHRNELNHKLQGTDSDIIGHQGKVNAFTLRLKT